MSIKYYIKTIPGPCYTDTIIYSFQFDPSYELIPLLHHYYTVALETEEEDP